MMTGWTLMDFLVYYLFVAAGTLLFVVAAVALAVYSGSTALFLAVVALAGMFLVAVHWIDLGIAPTSPKQKKIAEDRRVQAATDAARRTEWGRPPEIISIHHDNTRYPVHIEMTSQQNERLTLREVKTIHLWCVENQITVRRFLWSDHAEEYSRRLKDIFDRTDFAASLHPFKEIESIEHMAPRPFLAFLTEHDAFAFKLRWL